MTAAGTGGIPNHRVTGDDVVTGGQPTEDQLRAASGEGFLAVVNLATAASPGALPDEAGTVRALGMEYHHIPVDWESPTAGDLAAFERVLLGLRGRKTLVHCAANYRATAFYSLFAQRRLGWSAARADEFRASVWDVREYPVWETFVQEAGSVISRSPRKESS